MKKQKWILSLICLCLVAAFSFASADEASDYEAALAAANAQKQDLLGKIEWANQQTSSLLNELAQVDWELEWTTNELTYLQTEKSSTEQSVLQGQQQLALIEAELQKKYEVSKTRLRALYENGNVSYLEVLFGSSSFSEFLTSFDQITLLFQRDVKLLEEQRLLSEKQQEINTTLENYNDYLGSLAYQAEVRNGELATMRAERNGMMVNIQGQKESWQVAYDAFEAQAVALEETIRQLQAQNQGNAHGSGQYIWPVPSTYVVSDEFGWRDDPFGGSNSNYHGGLDIAGSYGANILAVDGGTVIYAGWDSGGYGNMVVLDHGNGIGTVYGHMSQVLVNVWDAVDKGDVIGLVGSTGWSTGPHLHIEFRVNGERVDPWNYLS